jgi:hypothetical protein
MNFETLSKTIWQADAGLTMEEAENLARHILMQEETRESKVTRVVRAEETR